MREGLSIELDEAPPVPVLSNAIARLELRDLERAINRLPEDQRTVVLLIGLEGMQYDRVAAILNVPIGTVRSRLARGRAKLRRLMSATRRFRRSRPSRRASVRQPSANARPRPKRASRDARASNAVAASLLT
jgi:DNA-directed RNA polymerase specialized sigma24 family protein